MSFSMIISRTPYRISFFGGGTDYPEWYGDNGGICISTSINHYCYISCKPLSPFFPYKSRIVWSKIEQVLDNKDIEHPVVRSIAKYFNIPGVEIHHAGDLPARSGIGSSSSFTVGMLNSVINLVEGKSYGDKKDLASLAIHIERNVLKENVGIQDQIAAACGGFNVIRIGKNGKFSLQNIEVPYGLENKFLLFFTGISRNASDIAKAQIDDIKNKKKELRDIQAIAEQVAIDISDIGHFLHESWLIKRRLKGVTLPFIDDIYDKGLRAGALGGKLLGAGGGGFILFYANPEHHEDIKKAVGLLHVPFKFENTGSVIL